MDYQKDGQQPLPGGLFTASTSRRDFLEHSLMALGGVAALSLAGWEKAEGQTTIPDWGKPGGPNDEAYWSRVREQFMFEPGIIYLNNGGLGVPPRPVWEAVVDAYRQYSQIGNQANYEYHDLIEEQVRPSLAQWVGADAGEVALTRNATEGLNAIANGIDLQPGDEVLTTTHEHPAGLEPWLLKSRRYGIVVRQIRVPNPPGSVEEVVELFQRAITPRTKVLFFCHITRGPGLLYPVKPLCALARQHGLVAAVDGAQSVGMMPVDLHEMGCDLFAASLHKWPLAPIGTGMLYVRKDFQERFWPLSAGSGPWEVVNVGAGRYEAIGTFAMPLYMGLGAALAFNNSIGIDHIVARNRMLSDYLKAQLVGIPEFRLATSTALELSSPGITSFGVKGWQASLLRSVLREKYRIMVSSDTMDRNNFLRVSTHFYNTTEQMDRILAALQEQIGKG